MTGRTGEPRRAARGKGIAWPKPAAWLMLAAALVGCPASTESPPADCAPYGLTLIREWPTEELPDRYPTETTQPGLGVGDVDGDGDLDALLAYGGGSILLRNDGTGALDLDPTATLDGGDWPDGGAAALADLDGDGDLDAFLARDNGGQDLLAWNDGSGTFTSTPLADSGGAPGTGAFADLDGDGDLDLALAQGIALFDTEAILAGTLQGDPDHLYFQGPTGVFTDSPDRIPQDDNYGITFQAAPLDADGDGDLDLYMANDWGYYLVPNLLLVNDGSGHFTRAGPDCYCELTHYAMGAAVGDADGDGLPDVYLSNLGGPVLLAGRGDGTFVDATLSLGADIPPSETNLTSWGTGFTDLDADGCIDIAICFGRLGSEGASVLDGLANNDGTWVDAEVQPDVVMLGDCANGFTRAVGLDLDAYPARGRALTFGDFDRDGRPDLLTTGKQYVRHWRSSGGCGDGVTVRLQGPPGNVQGLGARLDATFGGRSLTQWMLPSTTHSASAAELYLGFAGQGPATLRITWPDGQVTERPGVSGGGIVDISHPAAGAATFR